MYLSPVQIVVVVVQSASSSSCYDERRIIDCDCDCDRIGSVMILLRNEHDCLHIQTCHTQKKPHTRSPTRPGFVFSLIDDEKINAVFLSIQ